MKNLIFKIFLFMIVIVVIFGINGYLFITKSPQFGAPLAERNLYLYKASDNFNGDVFFNQIKTGEEPSLERLYQILQELVLNTTQRSPSRPIEPIQLSYDEWLNNQNDEGSRILWFGHSTFLMNTDGLNLLLDPMLTEAPSPHPWLVGKRYSDTLPMEIAEMPNIDAVLITHDHYDHLDYPSIQLLDSKVGHYYVPLGVAEHLIKWGVDAYRITELDWWETATLGNTEFTFTPARHFSGRSYNDHNKSLWGGWVTHNEQHTVYFTGDTGYGPHFKAVGDKFGEIDLALIDTGQYSEHWETIHLMPEDAIRAGMEANAKAIMPVHWGAFTLSLHVWDEPVERAIVAAEKHNQRLVIPQIGEIIELDKLPNPNGWWRQY